jgi:hypothetical protein
VYEKKFFVIVFFFLAVVVKSQNIRDTLGYLKDSIVAKSSLYVGNECKRIV